MRQIKKHGVVFAIMIMMFLAPITKIKSLAGSNLSTADPISIGSTISGIVKQNETLYYKFSLAGNTCIKFDIKTGGHNQCIGMNLMDSTGKEMRCSEQLWTNDKYNWGFQSGTINYALNAGEYFIKIRKLYSQSSKEETFSLSTTVTAVSGNSLVVAGQNNYFLSTAEGFNLGDTLKSVAYTYSFNWVNSYACHYYRFNVPITQNVQFVISPEFNDSTQSILFSFLDSNGKNISQSISLGYSKNRTGSFNKMLNAGTYYIEVKAFQDDIPYTISTSGTAPVINVSRVSGVKVSSPAKGRISIRWKTTSCTGYQVQISRSKYFLGRIYQRTYTTRYASYWGRKGMSRGKKYYVRVRAYTNAYGRTVYGSWSSVKSVKIRKR